jgi:hypothetical protein
MRVQDFSNTLKTPEIAEGFRVSSKSLRRQQQSVRLIKA